MSELLRLIAYKKDQTYSSWPTEAQLGTYYYFTHSVLAVPGPIARIPRAHSK